MTLTLHENQGHHKGFSVKSTFDVDHAALRVETDTHTTYCVDVTTESGTVRLKVIHLSDTGPRAENYYQHDDHKHADDESRHALYGLLVISSHKIHYNSYCNVCLDAGMALVSTKVDILGFEIINVVDVL